MRILKLLFSIIIISCIKIFAIASVGSEVDGKIKIILIIDDAFGVSYKIDVNNILSIEKQFENYGWDIIVAGVKDTIVPCVWSKENFQNPPLKTDRRITEINNITDYDALIIIPGNSYKNTVNNPSVLKLISEADKNDLVVAAWCRGVKLLAAAGIIKEKTIIGNIDYVEDYKRAEANYINFYKTGIREFHDVTPPIADGNIITTVRSLYYRNQMCRKIRQAVEKNVAKNEHKVIIDLGDKPVWTIENAFLSTGTGWADINQDGWIDLVVVNGIDAADQPAIVYFNYDGQVSRIPGWVSSYTLPGGNLFLADLNADNYPDLTVSHLGLSKKGFEPGSHVLFDNVEGKLSSTPVWLSPKANGFSCTGGDFDGDGDLDLAFGQGVNSIKKDDKKIQKVSIFFNENGTFSSTPGWQSDQNYLTNDICAIDIDNDGDLDLCISGKGFGVSVFYNNSGQLETIPSYFSDSILGTRQMAFGDIDGDGFQELAVAVPAKKFGSNGGKFCLFKNNDGVLEQHPYWECEQYKEPSCVAWADIDSDGDFDLIAGGFFSYLGIFENINGKLSDSFSWNYQGEAKKFIVQQITLGDYDQDYIINEVLKMKTDGKRKLFYTGHKNLQDITAIILNNKPIDPKNYCYDLYEGWISLAKAPAEEEHLSVIYSYSNDLDLAVTSLYSTDIFNNNAVNKENRIKMNQHKNR